MNLRLLLVLLLSMLVSCDKETKEEPAGPDVVPALKPNDADARAAAVAEITEVFRAYQQATAAKDGEAAAGLVSQATLDRYELLRSHVAAALDESDGGPARKALKSMKIGDRIMAAMMLMRIGRTNIKTMSGRDVYILGVREGWVGQRTFANGGLGPLVLNGAVATAPVLTDGEETAASWRFVNEGGWRIDLTALMNFADKRLHAIAMTRGISEDQLIDEILGEMPAIAPADQWQEYRPQGGGFAAQFPSTPSYEVKEEGDTKLQVYSATSASQGTFMVTFTELKSPVSGEDADLLLNSTAAGLVKGAQGELLGVREGVAGGLPMRALQFKVGERLSTAMVMVTATRLVQLVVVGPPTGDAAKLSLFFDSFVDLEGASPTAAP